MYQTQPQNMLNNRQIAWPSGKIVGGSSAVNGMYLVWPSSIEVDVWHGLIKNLDGSDAWTSDSFFAAMRKVRLFRQISVPYLSLTLDRFCSSSPKRLLPLAMTSAILPTSSTMKPPMGPMVRYTLPTRLTCPRCMAPGSVL